MEKPNKLIHEQIIKAVDASSQRMNKMTPEERQSLYLEGLKIIYPNGHETCGKHRIHFVKGGQCGICKAEAK